MNNIKVSVIVPVYNVEKFLRRCIDSIISQTYKNLEIILVDDGSTDNSSSICDEYSIIDKRIKVIHKPNGGLSSARNIGLDEASGEFISFVDSDDYLESDMYEEMMINQQLNHSDIVVSRFYTVMNGNVKLYHDQKLEEFCKTHNLNLLFNYSKNIESKEKIEVTNYVPSYVWRMLFSNDLISDQRFNEKCIIKEDLIFLINCLVKNDVKMSIVDKPLYNYVYRGNSLSQNGYLPTNKFYKTIIDLLDSLLGGTMYDDIVKYQKFLFYGYYIKSCLLNGNQKDAEIVKDWCCRENYLASKKFVFSRKQKIKNYLIYHKLFFLLKPIFKILN